MYDKLLANSVIEEYRYELVDGGQSGVDKDGRTQDLELVILEVVPGHRSRAEADR